MIFIRKPIRALIAICLLYSVITVHTNSAVVAASRKNKPKNTGPVLSIKTQKMIKSTNKHLAKARALREKGKNDQAIAEYRQALNIDPSSTEVALELAGLYYELGFFQQCAEILQVALPLAEAQGCDEQRLGEAYCQLAASHFANGAFDLANNAVQKAAKIIPNDPHPYLILGKLQAEHERFSDAFRSFRRALEIDPQMTEAWLTMGNAAIRARRNKEASEALLGLRQTDSLKANEFEMAMAKAGLKLINVHLPTRPTTSVDDPYADDAKLDSANTEANHISSLPSKPLTASSSISLGLATQSIVHVSKPKTISDHKGVEPMLPLPSATIMASEPNSLAAIASEPMPPEPADNMSTITVPLQNRIDEAIALLSSDDEATAARGKANLLALGAPAVPKLVEKLSDPDPNMRRRTLNTLAEFGPIAKDAFSAVEEALGDPDPAVAEAAQEAIDRIYSE